MVSLIITLVLIYQLEGTNPLVICEHVFPPIVVVSSLQSVANPFDPVSPIPPNLPVLLSLTALVQALVTSCLEHCKILPAAKAHSFIHKAHCLWC